jgi:uncharacterized membrane protein
MGYEGTTFNIFQILHVVAAIAAFGPLFVYPRLQRAGQTATVAKLHTSLVIPSLVLVWVLGMGLQGLSDRVIRVSHLWMSLSIVVWIALVAISWFMIKPSLNDNSERAGKLLSAGIGMSHLLLVVSLYLMVFQPGAPGA